jgi:hypothetical protein
VCWAGIIAVTAYLHSWPIPADQPLFRSYLLIFFGCLAACVAAGMVAAAVAAALMRGFRLLAALVAAGTASLAGLAGVYLFLSGDGCVAPLATFAKSCAWHPDVGWGFMQTFGTPALAVGSIAASGAALLILTAVAAATQRRARSVSATSKQARPTDQAWGRARDWSVSLLAKRTVIVALAAAAATMLAVTFSSPGVSIPGGQDSGSPSAASAASQLLPTATYSVSPQTTGVMVAAWLYYGGSQQVTALDNGFSRLGGAEDVSSARLQRLADKGGATVAQFRSALAPTVSACEAVMAAARSAEAYFPVPALPLQSQWQSVLTGFIAGAQGCTEGANNPSGTHLLASLKGMTQAGKNLYDLFARLKLVAGRLSSPDC